MNEFADELMELSRFSSNLLGISSSQVIVPSTPEPPEINRFRTFLSESKDSLKNRSIIAKLGSVTKFWSKTYLPSSTVVFLPM